MVIWKKNLSLKYFIFKNYGVFLNGASWFTSQFATRKAYGVALAKLGQACNRVVALDGDTKNSTFSELFKKEHPSRFIECYIAEQNMVCSCAAYIL